MTPRTLALVALLTSACGSTGSSSSSGGSSGSGSSGGAGGASERDASASGSTGSDDASASASASATAGDAGGASASTSADAGASTSATAGDAGGASDAGRSTTSTAPPPPPPPRNRLGSPPPRYTEVEAYLTTTGRGRGCFVHNVINADVTSAYVDGDFDGDGLIERIFHLPDCLAVITQGDTGWVFPVLVPRSIPQDFDSVSVQAVTANGVRLVEVRYVRDEPRTREVHRFRYNGHDLIQVQ